MMAMNLMRRLGRNVRGSMTIETAIVAPMLILLTLGTFEVGTIVARQHELQSAANESEIIAIATNRGADAKIDQVEAILRTSLGLADDQVTLSRRFRCGTDEKLVSAMGMCEEDEVVSTYMIIHVEDTYTPTSTGLGIGGPVDLSVRRRVQVS